MLAGALVLLVLGADPCPPADCAADFACARARAECLLGGGRAREAVDMLKPLAKEHGGPWARLLASAYAADENPFWAQKTLMRLLAEDEQDCESRAQLAWLHVQQGHTDLATELLDQEGCPQTHTGRGRWQLLRAYVHDVAGEESARHEALDAAGEADAMYAEDLALYRHLRGRDDPGWLEPVSARFELVAGYTTNGLAGSPTDTPTGDAPASGLGRVDAITTLVAPFAGSVRPTLELGLKGHGLSAEDVVVREQSYLELSARPTLLLGRVLPRVSVGYSADLLLVNHSERGRFYEGHRAEVDVEANETITVFAGGGRRIFHEGGRSRWEIDGGFGASVPLGARVHLLGVLAARHYSAVDPSYDQIGGTAAAVARLRPGYDTLARAGVTIGFDQFPSSGDRPENERAYGTEEKRQDLLLKVSLEGWSPPLWGARVGVRYELAWRNSSADLSVGLDNYDYTEHRMFAGVRWAWGGDPWMPRETYGADHVALDYGLRGGRSAGDEERIRDILRQDEAARRGSSCVN